MLRALICLWALATCAFAAAAEPRYALLIGNEDYPATVGRLSLPYQDVENMRSGLVQAGFPEDHVKVLKDATQTDINLAVAQLASDLRAAGSDAVGFFYYSGHGGSAESAGKRANYLIPAKSPITGAEQLPILGVPVNNIIDALAASDAGAIFFVSDACRNTLPFTSSKGGAADKGMVRVPRRRGSISPSPRRMARRRPMTACSRRRCRSDCRKRVSRLTGPSPSRFAKWLPPAPAAPCLSRPTA